MNALVTINKVLNSEGDKNYLDEACIVAWAYIEAYVIISIFLSVRQEIPRVFTQKGTILDKEFMLLPLGKWDNQAIDNDLGSKICRGVQSLARASSAKMTAWSLDNCTLGSVLYPTHNS